MSTMPFPLYLLPSIPFRRRRTSSTTTTSSSPSSSPPNHPTPTYLIPPSTSYLRCSKCRADLLPSTSIISKGFTGRHGRAYLVSPPAASTLYRPSPSTFLPPPSQVDALPNTKTHKPQPRQLVTGAHTVSDISCVGCGQVLGWKYVDAAEESQKYKVGKFILETKRVVRCVDWEDRGQDEDGEDREQGPGGKEGREGEADVEFDSQDEDECEDLFAGVWSRKVAARRRRERGAWA